jgi:hypothetical protein
VFRTEYREEWFDDESARAGLCSRAIRAGISTLVLPIDLDGSFRHSC